MLNLDVFNHGSISNLHSILVMAERAGIKDISTLLRQVEGFIKIEEKLHSERVRKVKAATPKCTKCGKHALELPVNNSPSTQVGGDYTFCVLCKGCAHVDYYTEEDRPNLQY